MARPFRCERPSHRAGWLTPEGELVPARCGAPNRCAYCAYLTTLENALVVAMDCELEQPVLGMTLTTRDPETSATAFRDDVRAVFRAVRRRSPDCRYLGLIEFTKGQGVDGLRRIHQHLLIKGVLPSEAETIEEVVREVWEARTGAHRVEVKELRSVAGSVSYLVHHHRKRDQAPPKGWTGKRFRPSRGYYSRPIAEMREEAAWLLRDHRVRKAAKRAMDWEELHGWPDDLVADELRAAVASERDRSARVCFVRLDHEGAIIPASVRPLRAA